MTLLVRNIIVSITLALSDFISFVLSLYISLGILKLAITDYDRLIPYEGNRQLDNTSLAISLLLCCMVLDEIASLFLSQNILV